MGKEILSLFRRDLSLGFYTIRYRWFASMFLLVIMLVAALYKFNLSSDIGELNFSTLTHTDLVFSVLKGSEYQVIGDPESEFPYTWFIIQLMGPFMLGGYLRDDLFDQSSFLFIRAKHRLSLWVSKLLFSITVVLSMYVFLALMTIVFSFLFLSLSPKWSDYGEENILPLLSSDLTTLTFTVSLMLLPLLIAIVTVVVQAVLSVFMPPIYALIAIIVSLTISVYSTSSLLPGSYSMILRHQSLDQMNGFTWNMVFIYISVVLIVVVISGFIRFKRMDIFPKGKD